MFTYLLEYYLTSTILLAGTILVWNRVRQPAQRLALGKAVLAAMVLAGLLLAVPGRPQTAVFQKHVAVQPAPPEIVVPMLMPIVNIQTEIQPENSALAPVEQQAASAEMQPPFRLPSNVTLFLAFHLLLSLVLLLRLLAGAVQAAGVRTKSTPLPGEKNVRTSREISAPVVLGILRPVILLPETFYQEENAESIRLVLAHEREHLENGDLRTVFLGHLLKVLLPLQPLLSLLLRRVRQEQEILADAAVCRNWNENRLGRRIEYAEKLVRWTKTARHVPHRTTPQAIGLWEFQSLANTTSLSTSTNRRSPMNEFQTNELTRRVHTILRGSEQITRKSPRYWNFTLGLGLLATVFVLSGITLSPKTIVTAQQKEPEMEHSAVPGPNPVREGNFEPARPVQDAKKVNVRCLALLPNGEIAKGISWQFSSVPQDWTIGSGGFREVSGKFNTDVPANMPYVVAVFDKQNRYAAPMQTITVGDESPEGELVFQFEEGVPLTAAFVDEDTGTPIPGLRISLMQRAEVAKEGTKIWFDKTSNEEGLFQAHVMPGEYVVSVDILFNNPEAVRKGVYARKFAVEAGKPVSLEFRIPSPFLGKVLDIDGTPAKNRTVFLLPNDMRDGGATFTSTDQDGLFRCTQKLVNVTVNVLGRGGEGQYFAWFGNELAAAKEHTFQLVEGTELTGRLFDAKTKEPLATFLVLEGVNPNDPTQKELLPNSQKTDASGRFSLRLNPTVLNDLFIVYGRQSAHGGGPYEPRIDIVVLSPEQLKGKEVIDLGDIYVEP